MVVRTATVADPAGVEFVEKKILPGVTEHSQKCHSAEAAEAKKLKGGGFSTVARTVHGRRAGGESISFCGSPGLMSRMSRTSALKNQSVPMPPCCLCLAAVLGLLGV